jgi:hypothetical protein
MLTPKENLETVNPQGRVDVLTYKAAEKLARWAESKWQLNGIWDNMKPHIHDLVTKNVSGLEIPSEAKVLLGIIQANIQTGVKEIK